MSYIVIYTLSLHDALPICRRYLPRGRPLGQPAPAHRDRVLRGNRPGVGEAASARSACGCRAAPRSEEHTSELQSLTNLVCRLLLEKKKYCRRSPNGKNAVG